MAQVPYQGYANVAPESGGLAGGSSDYSSVPEANANAFGAQVGGAMQNAGQQVDQLAQKFSDIYNDSTARDATTKTASDMAAEQARFMQLKGNDAVNGLKEHQDNLNAIVKQNSNGLSVVANQMYQKDSSYMVDRALYSAGAHVGEQAEYAQKTSLKGAIDSAINGFALNPSDQDSIHNIYDNSISLNRVLGVSDKNVDEANASHNFGEAFTRAIEANQYSNPPLANKLFDQAVKGSYIAPDGTKIPFLDAAHLATLSEKMHSSNKIMDDNAAYDALLKGNPIPAPVGGGMKEVQVKSAVASDAQAKGIDPSLALMVTGLESSFGRTSDNLGGVKGMTATTIQGHADNQNKMLSDAIRVANNAVGGNATPAQIYMAYQQGSGGGAALLKALQTVPNASALDVLTPLYKTQEEAASALTGNGMPANATVKQVANFIQNKCDAMYGQVRCSTTDASGNQIDLGKAIIQPHVEAGVPQQVPANPVDALKQFNDLYQSRQDVISSMPFDERRKSLQQHLEADEARLKKSVEVYNEQNTEAIRAVTSQPDFYSVNDSRITPEMRSFMDRDQKAYNAVYQQAERNRLVAKGEAGGKTPLGDGFSYLQQQAYAGKLNTTDMFYHLGEDLTQAGFDKLKEVVKSKSPDSGSDNDEDLRARFYKNIKDTFVHNNVFGNTYDAEKSYQNWFASVSNTVNSKSGSDLANLLDPTSKDYVGKNTHQFIPPSQQQLAQRAQKINSALGNSQDFTQGRAPGETPEDYLSRIK